MSNAIRTSVRPCGSITAEKPVAARTRWRRVSTTRSVAMSSYWRAGPGRSNQASFERLTSTSAPSRTARRAVGQHRLDADEHPGAQVGGRQDEGAVPGLVAGGPGADEPREAVVLGEGDEAVLVGADRRASRRRRSGSRRVRAGISFRGSDARPWVNDPLRAPGGTPARGGDRRVELRVRLRYARSPGADVWPPGRSRRGPSGAGRGVRLRAQRGDDDARLQELLEADHARQRDHRG